MKGSKKTRSRRARHFESLEHRLLLSASNLDGRWFEVVEPANTFLFHGAIAGNAELGPSRADDPPPSTTAGRWIVKLKPDASARLASPQAVQGLLRNVDGPLIQVERGLGMTGLVSVRSFADKHVVESALANNPYVFSVEQDNRLNGQTAPNDPRYPELDGLRQTNVEAAWDSFARQGLAIGSYDVVVGILDTGIDLSHRDLYLNIWLNQGEIPARLIDQLTDVDQDGLITLWDLNQADNKGFAIDRNGNGYIDAKDLLGDPDWSNQFDEDENGFIDDLVGWDFLNNDNDPSDDHRHGTHVAGTIGAIGNNETDIVGINWKTSMMALKMLDENNRGLSAEAVLAVNYMTMMRTEKSVNVRVANTSFVGTEFSPALQEAIARGGESDVLLVAAAGNGDIFGDGENIDDKPRYPASYELDNIISVTASNPAGTALASFGNFGSCNVLDDLQRIDCSVDIAAPGVGIVSTRPTNVASTEFGSLFTASRNGTSMAAPHVAGIAALLFAHEPDASAREVRDALLDNVRSELKLQGLVASAGLVDAEHALSALQEAPSARLIAATSITEAGDEPIYVTVQYGSAEDSERMDEFSLGDDDLSVTRDGFPDQPLSAQLVDVCWVADDTCVPTAGSDITPLRATYVITPPNRHTDLGFPAGWNATDNGDYQIHLRGSTVRSQAGVGNRTTHLTINGEYSFQVEIEDPSVIFANTGLDAPIAEAIRGTTSLRIATHFANLIDDHVTIVLPPDTYQLQQDLEEADDGAWGDIDIVGDVTIIGTDQATTTIDASSIDRVLHVHSGGRLRITGVTLTGGAALEGGGIKIEGGTVQITRSTIRGNSAFSEGGGIWNGGDLTVSESTIDQNEVTSPLGFGGGGIYNSGNLRVDASTISNNRVAGGFLNNGGGGGLSFTSLPARNVVISNTTISGNQANSGIGGGVNQLLGEVEFIHTTITNNSAAGSGGGIAVPFPSATTTLDIGNSIIAGNFASTAADVFGPFQATGFNLVGVDPKLGPLGDNGGLTKTHVLLPDSPAISAAPALTPPLEIDQRGLPRPADELVSVGAVEKHFAEIRGRLFHDVDGDGERGVNEQPLAEWIVYVDINDNQNLDAGEPNTITRIDDPATPQIDESQYVINGLDPKHASVAVRTVPRTGYVDSTPVVVNPSRDSTTSTDDDRFQSIVAPTESIAPIFHLDFSVPEDRLADLSALQIPIQVGAAVSTVPEAGPRLENGRQLDAGRWQGMADHTNQIRLFDHPLLDDASQTAGSVVTWIKVENDQEWNGILITTCDDQAANQADCEQFSQTRGIEFQTNQLSGVFGSAQGWSTNNFGPQHPKNGGTGGTETPAGEWTHVALTWNAAGDHTIYVNGVKGRTVEGVGNEPFGLNNPSDWLIGADNVPLNSSVFADDINRRNLRGDLADFAIFSDELDGQTINDIIRNGVPVPVRTVFHLDFSGPADQLGDVSASALPIHVGSAVTTISQAGPVLENGKVLDAGLWAGAADNSNQILLLDHPSLDEVSTNAGSIATWIKVDNQQEWNSIVVTGCDDASDETLDCPEFGVLRGVELATNVLSGALGSVQGWGTNTFGPAHRSNGGPGGPEAVTGIWTHVALTWNDNGDHTVYVNGVPGQVIEGVGKDAFGLNEPKAWTIGGDNAPLNVDYPADANGRRLRGQLADFAIFDGELNRQMINNIMRFGVPDDDSFGGGVRSFASFGTEPSIVGNRIVFEDHLGRVQLKEGADAIVPLVGLNTVSTESQPFADGQSISYDGELVAFSGRLGLVTRSEQSDRVSGIFVVDQFGAFQELASEDVRVPGIDSFAGKSFEVHSISESLVAFGVREPDTTDEASGRLLKRGINRLGLFVAIATGDTDTPVEIAKLADSRTSVPGTNLKFQTFGKAQLDETTFAFQATHADGFGIYEQRGTAPLRTVVDQDTQVPRGAFLTSIESFAFSEGEVLFHGIGPAQEGIYLSDGESVTVLADQSTEIPSDSGQFQSFGNVAFNKGNTVFVGRGRPSEQAKTLGLHEQVGIYVILDEQLEKVVDLQPNDQPAAFGGRMPVALSIGPEAISGNRVVFYAAFSDGTDGIFTAAFNSQSKHDITLEPGIVIEGLDFGRQPLPGQIRGQSFEDINRNGRRDADEPGLRGWTVFLDQNSNGSLDPGEPATNTGETGNYAFTELPALRNYVVRQVPRANWVDSAAFGSSYDVFLAANEIESNLNFANRRTTQIAGQGGNGVIRVAVFNDNNANGRQDAGESLRNDREVYIDVNSNGVFDDAIDALGTLVDGKYEFSDLAMISHEVRLRRTDGLQQTSPLGNSFDTVKKSNVGDRPTAIVGGLFDDDEHVDLIVGNNTSNTLSFLSDATRTSSNATATIDHRGNGPVSMVVDDFDFDGDLDVAVANFHSSDVSVLLGNGDGTFGAPTIYPTGEQAGPVTIASIHLNDDPLIDLVVTNSISDRLTLLSNLGNGGFKITAMTESVGDKPQGIITGRFTADALEDIVVVLQDPTQNSGSIRLLTNLGENAFALSDPIMVGGLPSAIVSADFDGDEHLDVAVANLGSSSISVLFGNGQGLFTRQHNIRLDAAPIAISQADLDGDNDIDLIYTRAGELPVALLRNDGRGVFQTDAFAGAADFPDSALPFSVASTDVSGDGVVDLVLANRDTDSITILENRIIAGSHRVTLETTEFEKEVSFGVLLIPGDANLDGLVSFPDFLALATHFGGPGGWAEGDFNEDGKITFADFIIFAINYGKS